MLPVRYFSSDQAFFVPVIFHNKAVTKMRGGLGTPSFWDLTGFMMVVSVRLFIFPLMCISVFFAGLRLEQLQQMWRIIDMHVIEHFLFSGKLFFMPAKLYEIVRTATKLMWTWPMFSLGHTGFRKFSWGIPPMIQWCV